MKLVKSMTRLFFIVAISMTNYWQIVSAQALGASGALKWLRVNSLHMYFSEHGAEVETGGTEESDITFSWPAEYGLQTSTMRANAFIVACRNFYDKNIDRTFPYFSTNTGLKPDEYLPTRPVFDAHEFKLVGRFQRPIVTVDGELASSNAYYDILDEVDEDLAADRVIVVKNNTVMGMTITKKVYAFTQQNHENYYIYDYVLKNTGVVNTDGTIYEQTLQDFYFGLVKRFAFAGEGSDNLAPVEWAPSNSYWGKNTVNDVIGSDPAAPDFMYRAEMAWYDPYSQQPVEDDWGCPNYLGDGTMAAAKFSGFVTLHADKSVSDKSDDLYQPKTTTYQESDSPVLSRASSWYDEPVMTMRYDLLSRGHDELTHAQEIEVSGLHADQWAASMGGYSAVIGYGPYTLSPGDSLHFVLAGGVAGLSREKNREVGSKWLQWTSGQGTPELIMPNGSPTTDYNEYKKRWVLTCRDSLMKMFANATANYESGYDVPQPPPPPETFTVQSGGDYIRLSWADNATSYPNFGGYVILRSEGNSGNPNAVYKKIWECDASNVAHEFDDATAARGFDYYYAIQSKDDGSTNEVEPGKPLLSHMLWTLTSKPAFSDSDGSIQIDSVNSETVGLYEKFEVTVDLGDSVYENPYNPDEIDLSAVFISPTGVEWSVFGFYDDYENADAWKVRFSPNETGQWEYTVYKTDREGSEHSGVGTFTAIQSDRHGWIEVSKENPHYMQYEDGTPFYGVGMYTPWGNSVEIFDELESYGANLFAIWNITYGGMVNSYGLIEEELGRYNQTKCGKIDELLEVAEDRDLKCMYCFWPHDLFSETVWAHQWHQNPYREICAVEDVYSDPICWEYQEKQYRYLIARFGYSRALGIWEIMNEINGTDGWAQGNHEQAREWVQKVHDYFKENDPYKHLTTASRSGGYSEYWSELYEIVDLPNVHVYENQGWPQIYGNNPLRSSVNSYASGSARLWNGFKKPAIFGEAGANSVYVDLDSPDYTDMYHNALWAGLTNGIAATPVWWMYTDPITEAEREQMLPFSDIVSTIDFIHMGQKHFESITDAFDLCGMANDTSGFGWIRETNGKSVTGLQFDLEGVFDSSISALAIHYIDPWTGESLETRTRPHTGHKLREIVPNFGIALPDVAFTIQPAQNGEIPVLLEVSSDIYEVWNDDTLSVPIICYLFDAQGRFCSQADNEVTFSILGPGELVQSGLIKAVGGVAQNRYLVGNEPGEVKIVVSADGLASDSLSILVKDRLVLDDFESYTSDADLQMVWTPRAGTTANVSLDESAAKEGTYGMRLDYGIGTAEGYRSSSTLERSIDRNVTGGLGLRFWLKPDGSNREMEVRIVDDDGAYWTYVFSLEGTDYTRQTIPFETFVPRRESQVLDLNNLASIRLSIRKGEGENGAGALYFDEIEFPSSLSGVEDERAILPDALVLFPNYPNPFNPETNIQYSLPKSSLVNIKVFNLLGEEVETLVDKQQAAGVHRITWRAAAMPSGLYIIQLKAGSQVQTRKLVLQK